MKHVIKLGTQYLSTSGDLTSRQSDALRVDVSVRDAFQTATIGLGASLSAGLRLVRLRPRTS